MVAETKTIPATRFPSFSDKWMPERLGEWFSSSRAKGTEGIPTLSVTLDRGLVNRDELERKQETNLTAQEHLLVRDGDIAYNMMRMWQGAFGRADSDGIVSPAYVVLRGKTGVDTRFFEYAFRRSRSIYLFWAYSYGLTKDRLRLYANDFTRIPFSAPSLPEQKKIADFLTSVDERIGQLIKKKALLEDYKKGAMQQLFSQQIRFKDDNGNDFPDWEEKKFGEVASIMNGYAFKSNDFDEKQLNKVVRMSDLKSGRLAESNHALVSDDIVNGLERFSLKEGDFLFGMSGSLSNFAWIMENDLPAFLNQRVGCLRGKNQNIASFVQYLYLSEDVQKRIEQSAVGAAQLNISTNFLNGMELSIPSPHEQKKIADFLSAIDQKIESVSQQIAKTQTFKKGLLQQMFV